jgi:hypothetical protein
VADVAAVQAHIDGLEQFRASITETGRRDFVASLVKTNKILAPQGESMTTLVLTMSDQQFEVFKSTYEGATENPLLAPHGSTTPAATAQSNALAEEKATLEEIVASHKRSGKSPEFIESTQSFQRLQQINNG